MIPHRNTISKHQTIKHNVFDLLLILHFTAEGKNTKDLNTIGLTELIDYVDELKFCHGKLFNASRHDEAVKTLDKIIVRLTQPEELGEAEINEFLESWRSSEGDLEHCQERLVHW